MEPVGQISPDGNWWWDGAKWVSTTSADGLWRWNGKSWIGTGKVTAGPPFGGSSWIPGFRTGKVWKLPIVASGFLLLLAGIASAMSQPPSQPAGQGGVAEVSASAAPSTEAHSSHSPTSRAASPSSSPSPSPSPAPSPSPVAVQPPPAPAPQPPPPAQNTCGAPQNPWGYNFCGGQTINSPPSDFCSYFNCIPSFWTSTNGYVDQCADGTYSHSGGRPGACSHHGGEARPLYGP
jgi:hypothetical protein